ncbi:MAG: ATP-binding protein [Deltaproteobacteria bacterium]|nr:ATP-binding protein [Deltaproteobacteria bacterium]
MKKKEYDSIGSPRPSRGPFLQPLALAGVCFVFVVLLLTLAAMDFRALDKTLVAYVEKQGFDFIGTVQQAVDFNLERTNNIQEWDLDGTVSSGLVDQRPSLQESMVMEILQLAQRIDHETENGMLSNEALSALVSRQGLWNLILFDDRGGLKFNKRSVPGDVEKAVSMMIRDHEDLNIHLFENLNESASSRFLALRRKNGKGFAVLVFDRQSFLFWRLKMALEMAVDAVGMPSNTDCLLIRDGKGRTLFQSETCPDVLIEGDPLTGDAKNADSIFNVKVLWEGRSQLMMVEKITLREQTPLTAYLQLNTENLDLMIGKEKRWGLMSMGFMVFLVVLSMWFLYRNQNRHIARVRQMDRLLQQAERLSAMGRLASGVAHEIRNPLNAISMACQRLKEENLQQLSGVIRNEIGRLNMIVEEFLGLSKERRLKLEKTDLADLVQQVGLLMEEEARARGIEIRTSGIETTLMMWMDGNRIKQALINMVKNAMDAIIASGTVTISIHRKGKDMAVVSLSDTGTGLAEEDLDKIFNLDFTTKEQGLGMGLALSHEIIKAHGGEIKVQSAPGVGTTFLILLPIKAGMN